MEIVIFFLKNQHAYAYVKNADDQINFPAQFDSRFMKKMPFLNAVKTISICKAPKR